MFWTRTLSGIVLLIILGFVFASGGYILLAFLGIISVIGLYEFYKAVKLLEEGQKIMPLALVGYLGCIGMYASLMISGGNVEFLIYATSVVMVLLLCIYVFTFPKYKIQQIAYALFGFVYVAVMLSFIYFTRALTGGKFLVWLVFMASWICDIFAYCVGKLFGKHKLVPLLSPKKSIEGSIGGIVFSAIFGGVYGYFVKGYISEGLPVVLIFVVVCIVGSAVSQIGDLAASAIKRNYDIKDYGKLIPGHGGILDRFDSMLYAAPMIYLVAYIIMSISA